MTKINFMEIHTHYRNTPFGKSATHLSAMDASLTIELNRKQTGNSTPACLSGSYPHRQKTTLSFSSFGQHVGDCVGK